MGLSLEMHCHRLPAYMCGAALAYLLLQIVKVMV